ncbi:MAG: rRNA maturation RNase YbeY [Acidimicrobiales bacterium]
MEVFVADEQGDQPVDVARWESLARDVLTAEGVSGDAELALLFVDEAAIAELNQRFMGHDGPTDVLAFPIDDDDVLVGRSPDGSSSGPDRGPVDDVPLLLGDVVVCQAVAALLPSRGHLRRRAGPADRPRDPPRPRPRPRRARGDGHDAGQGARAARPFPPR